MRAFVEPYRWHPGCSASDTASAPNLSAAAVFVAQLPPCPWPRCDRQPPSMQSAENQRVRTHGQMARRVSTADLRRKARRLGDVAQPASRLCALPVCFVSERSHSSSRNNKRHQREEKEKEKEKPRRSSSTPPPPPAGHRGQGSNAASAAGMGTNSSIINSNEACAGPWPGYPYWSAAANLHHCA